MIDKEVNTIKKEIEKNESELEKIKSVFMKNKKSLNELGKKIQNKRKMLFDKNQLLQQLKNKNSLQTSVNSGSLAVIESTEEIKEDLLSSQNLRINKNSLFFEQKTD